MVLNKFTVASIVVMGMGVSAAVVVISLAYFTPYKNCLRSMLAKSKGEAWAVQVCQWNHYMMGEPPQTLRKIPGAPFRFKKISK